MQTWLHLTHKRTYINSMNNNSMCSSSNNNKLHQRDHGNTKQASPDSQKNPAYDVEDTRRQAAINALKAMVQDGAMVNASGFQVNAYGVPSWIISIRITFELWNGMVGRTSLSFEFGLVSCAN